jgi:hypothetical protein
MPFTSTPPTPATLYSSRATLAADAFAGGTLTQRPATGEAATYTPSASSAEDEDGEITLTIAADLDPAADEDDTWEIADEDGTRWACDMVDAGTSGSPYTVTIGNLRQLPGSASLGGSAFTSTAPTPKV